MGTATGLVFQDLFEVSDVDPHGKKFDRVSRIVAVSKNIMDMELTLDINSELYPLEATETFTLVLSKSLSPNADSSSDGAMMTNADSLADDYDYVMYGKVYKYDDAAGSNVAVYVSFGGLLMCLAGDQRHLQELNVGDQLYLLMRK